MSVKKSNIDWLRQIIEKSESKLDSDDYKEAIEFLDAVQEDMDDIKRESDCKDDEITSLESDLSDKQGEINDLENQEPSWSTINAGIGHIEWQSDNIQLQGLMEALEERLKKSTPNEITALLEKNIWTDN